MADVADSDIQRDRADAGGLAAAVAPARPWRDLLWTRLVGATDTALRRWYGVREFTDDPACLLRISRGNAPRRVELGDGTRIAAGGPIAVLHIWNEQLPRCPAIGADIAWASLLRRRMLTSLRELARHLTEDPAWQDVDGIHACVTFGSRRRRAQIRRVAARFGFEQVEVGTASGLHAFGEDLLIWGFIRAFNPPALRGHALRRDRTELWISRSRLVSRYR